MTIFCRFDAFLYLPRNHISLFTVLILIAGFGGSTIDSSANAAATAASLAAGLYPRTNVYEYSAGVAPQIPR